MTHINAVSFTILVVLFAVVTFVGFAAARWRRAEDVLHLNEWGLGGRGFGTFVTWFLLGGDLYTAYTFIAVPALVFGTGAAGFFTLSYTIMVYPIVFVFLPRLWSVARVHGYITPADFIRGRYGSRGLSLAVAFTGILAVMPYIALQLVGIQSVLTVMGVGRQFHHRVRARPAADHRLPHPGRLHVRLRAAGPGADRVHQGHADLRDDHRGDHLHPDPGGRLGAHLQRRRHPPQGDQPQDGQAERQPDPGARPGTGPTPRSPWARPWPCSCTRTTSRAYSRPTGAT